MGAQDSPIPDQTRGILTYVREACPANYHPEVQYVSVAGKYIKGAKIGDRDASLLQQVIGAGYQAVCGSAVVWGDGVVPLPSAHLEGNPSPRHPHYFLCGVRLLSLLASCGPLLCIRVGQSWFRDRYEIQLVAPRVRFLTSFSERFYP